MRASTSQLRALSDYSACDVSDALVKLKYEHGGYIPDLEIFSPADKANTKIIGEAFTVKMVEGSDKDSPKPSQHFVDAAEEGSIMVISVPANCKNASWGGLMTARAQAKQVKGVIIDGRCRDLAEHREAGFPIFARGHSTLGQSPFIRPNTLQEPVTIHATRVDPEKPGFPSMTVNPHDIIVADEDGVVVIQPGEIDEVLELCKHSKEVDAKCMADLKKGRSVAETFKEHRGK